MFLDSVFNLFFDGLVARGDVRSAPSAPTRLVI